MRALLFGLGAALAGAVIYGMIAVLTGFEFGLIAILIGWMVGKAMMKGSRGKGGRRFQVAAVLITYLSITGGYVPTIVQQLMKMEGPADSATAPMPPVTAAEMPDVALALVLVLGIAAIAPFLILTSGISGLLGVVIIGVGLMQAWRETREQRFAISGPFTYEPKRIENTEAPT